ncbi:Apicidin F synthase [Colletotrichum orbiculare MAFF 240422]|uniref:Apicidin F synthase n=1 Tax=Colletotrichum orbiculare (strain 104-T / ATCC 96160 / CBS 514.97 / LARS 414 / MAFF 240422) TaxID=1213857 RepID=N4VBR6_COLOR|nr:Apicidin F synthase [Colletotrichum orbiculare MAFF 240422]
MCVIQPFAGAEPHRTDSFHFVDVKVEDPGGVGDQHILAAWGMLLHFYSREKLIQFGHINGNRERGTKTCVVEAQDTIASITRQLSEGPEALNGGDAGTQYNTAVEFIDAGRGCRLPACKNSESKLPDGVKMELRVYYDGSVVKQIRLLFYAHFMSIPESENVAATFEHLLTQTQGNTEKLISELGLSERDQSGIQRWNSQDIVHYQCLIHEAFTQVAAQRPDQVAVDAWDGRLTYAELSKASDAFAHHLMQRGVRPGSMVLLSVDKSKFAAVSFLAVLKVAGVCVFVDPQQPLNRTRQMMESTGASYVITTSFADASLAGLGLEVVAVVSELQAHVEPPATTVWPKSHAEDTAFVIFTSGSTGNPKGVMLTHAGLYTTAKYMMESWKINSETRLLQFSAYTFDMGITDMITVFLAGGCLCIPSESDRLERLQEYTQTSASNWVATTPTVARFLDPEATPSIRTIALVGEAVKECDARPWIDAGVTVFNGYGPTEATGVSTTSQPLTETGKATCIGPGLNKRTWIVDVERHQLVPVGAVGELVLEGPSISPGYLNDPEKTQEAFLHAPAWAELVPTQPATLRRFYRTGDLVRYWPDGTLECLGRRDSQVKLGAQRVELGEIEFHLGKSPSISQFAVLLPHQGPLAERLTVITSTGVQHHAGQDGPGGFSLCEADFVAELQSHLLGFLPAYMLPTTWLKTSSLPFTSHGKLDRKSLRLKLENLSEEEYIDLLGARTTSRTADDTKAEHQLRETCSQILNIPASTISFDHTFLAHGGDSITAMQVAAALRQDNQSLTVRDLISSSSLRESAARMSDVRSQAPMPVVEPGKRFPLSPIQRLFFGMAKSQDTRNHFHQSVLVTLSEKRSPEAIEKAIYDLVARHDMLRARFEELATGEWLQYVNPTTAGSFEVNHHPGTQPQADKMLESRLSLSVEKGPILRADLFESNGIQTLFVVIHHLVVDLVSWRVILEDLQSTLMGEKPRPQSFPFLGWVEKQHEMARHLSTDRVLPRSASDVNANFEFWGIEKSRNVHGDVKEMRFSIHSDATEDVLSRCHDALRTEPVDILIAAVLLAFERSFPERNAPTVFTEAHGRETEDAGVDVSRTVGWFTAMYPISVQAGRRYGNLVDLVMRVKDARKQTPTRGFDYFTSAHLTHDGRHKFGQHIPSEILFNYEGRYQALEKESSLFRAESWTAGEALEDMSPELQRFTLFEISASVLQNQLNFTFAWNSKVKHQARIKSWVDSVPTVLEEIAAELKSSSARFTLSDFDQLDLNYPGLDKLQKSILEIPGVEALDDVEDVYPLSPMQESLALSQARLDNVYEVDMTWEITTSTGQEIDVQRLRSAWQIVINKHAVMRTVLLKTLAASVFDQVVLKRHRGLCQHLKASDAEDALRVLSSHPAKDTGSGLHRLLVCTTDDNRVFLRLEINHIVFDGMSLAPMLRDLSLAYSGDYASVARRTDSHVRLRFADFVRYIRNPSLRERSISYWRGYLADAEPCIFPSLLDTKQDEGQQKVAPISLDMDNAAMQAKISELGVTFPALVQLVWSLVLRCYTSGNQTVTGYLAAGRDAPLPGIQDAVGPFLSMLLCRIDFTQRRTLLELLLQVQEDTSQASCHQASSLAEIQNAIRITGGTLFNAGISFMPLLDSKAQQGNCLLFSELSLKDPTEFELALIVESGEVANRMSIHYSTSLISEGHAANIAATVNHFLVETLRNTHLTPDELPGLSSRDLDQIWSWNKTCIEPVDECVHHFVERSMAAHPSKEAIFSWDGSLSYGELDDVSRNLAFHLAGLGVGPETIVPLCFEKSKYAVVSMLAVLRAGGCFVMLDPTHPDSRVVSIAEEVEAPLILCSQHTRPKFTALSGLVIVIEQDYMHALPQTHRGITVCPSVTPDNAMYVVYTSGTTGKPKGSITSHRAYCTGFKEHAWAIEVGPESRTLQFSAYSFDASVGDILTTLLVGGCICIPSDEDRSLDISSFIAKSRATWAGWTPSFASLVDPESVPTLTVLLMAGEPLPASQVDAWVDRLKVLNIYGPSECSVACVVNKEVNRQTHASNIGKGYRCVTWIVDSNDHERLLPIGCVGELLIEGPIVARGYLKRPEKTAEVFMDKAPSWLTNGTYPRNNRLYRTGDLVRYNSDGSINFVGRKDTQLKINGQRVELGEIEHSLRSSLPPTAGPIVVDLLKRSNGGEKDMLAAFIHVGAEDASTGEDPDDIIATDAQSLGRFHEILTKIYSNLSSLPRYMTPQVFVPLRVLPITTAGKLDRRSLQRVTAAMSREQLVTFASRSSNRDELTGNELAISRVWKQVLGLPAVGRQDNFFRLGGDSILAITLRSQALRVGIDISVSDVFKYPVLAEMVKVMAAVDIAGASEAEHEAVPPFSLLNDYESPATLVEDIAEECGLSAKDIEDVFPCAPMQEALMALSSLQSSAQPYVLHAPYRLPADIDEGRFLKAWESTVRDHVVLRSRIVLRPRGSLLVIAKQFSVSKHTCSLEQYLDNQKAQPFEYGSSLLRLALVSEGNDSYFVFSAHHAVYDGWSTKIIWETVLQHYRGIPSPGPTTQFQTLIKRLRDVPVEESREYWRKEALERHGISFPAIPASHKPVTRSRATFSLPGAFTTDRNVTVATLINAAWAIVNAQYAADSTATYGCTLSGRDFPLPGIEGLVGPVIVTVPRQVVVDPGRDVADFLEYVQNSAVKAIPHQYLGLSEIQAAGPVAQEAYEFTSLMVIHPDTVLALPFEELGITPVALDLAAESFTYPLAIEFFPAGEELNVDVRFDPECIEPLMIDTVFSHFSTVLQRLCNAERGAQLGSVMDMGPTDLALVESWNAGKYKPLDTCVHDLVDRRVKEQPNKVAVVSHDASITYSELSAWADQLATHVLDTNLTHIGDYVGVCLDKSAAAIATLLAVWKSGCAFMPLNPDHPPARLQALLQQADVKLVLASPDRVDLLSAGLSCKVLPVSDYEPLGTCSPLLSTIKASPSQPAYLIFTSGSTGKPKGVVVPHRSSASPIAAHAECPFFSLGPNTRMLQFSSFTFDAMIFEIFVTLTAGGCVCVPSEKQRLNDLSGFINELQVNTLITTPSVTRLLSPAKVPSLSLLMVGGEPLAPSDIEAWISQPGVSFVNAYGPTEACVLATAHKVQPSDSNSNIGVPVGGAAWVVSPVTGTLAPIGAVGELCLEGNLSSGYLGDPERTNEVFELEPPFVPVGSKRRIYHTGDLVRYTPKGDLIFVGRRDGQVKLRGQRIEVGEIEENIRRILIKEPSFKHVGVELFNSPGGRDQYLVTLLAMDISYGNRIAGIGYASMLNPSNTQLYSLALDLQKQLRDVLPEYMVPSAYVAVEQLHATSSGKRDRNWVTGCLSELVSQGELFPQVAHDVSSTDLSGTETLLQDWWAQVLDMAPSKITASSHFFSLGGNSITGIRLVGLARSLKYSLLYESIFQFPTLSEMASHVYSISELERPLPRPFELLPRDSLSSIQEGVLPLYGIDAALVEDVYPCTPLQEGLMAITARNPGAYISADIMNISESELPKLKEAWNSAFDKFELLRTRIVLSHEKGALQVVLKEGPQWHKFGDVASFLGHVHEVHGYGKRLVHLAVIPSSEPDTVSVVFSAHHATYDGWSLGLVRTYLERCLVEPRVPDVVKNVPFKSFIRQVMETNFEEAESYWEGRMEGLEAPSFPRLSNASGHKPLATALLERRLELPSYRASVVTMANVIRSAWALTISHYTAELDTLFGTIVSGRESNDISQIEAIAGPTIATVPSRIVIDYDSTVLDFLTSVQRDAASESRFSQVGLQRISRISQDCQKSCGFGSILVVQPPFNRGSGKLPQLRQGPVSSPKFFPQSMVLDCSLTEDNTSIDVTLSFDPKMVADAKHVLSTFSTLLCGILTASPDAKLRHLSALSVDHVRILETLAGDEPQAVDICTHHLIDRHVRASPSRTAVDAWDGSLSYSELDATSSLLAQKLRNSGIGPEVPVLLMLDKSKFVVAAMLAVWKSGGFFVPLDPKFPKQRLRLLVETAKATVVLTSPQYLEHCRDLGCEPLLVTEETMSLERYSPPPHPQSSVQSHNSAYLLFTSGSTGVPKGVIVEHRSLSSTLESLGSYIGLNGYSRMLQVTALTFDAMLLNTFGPLVHGSCVCIPRDLDNLAGFVEEFQVNTTWFTTSLSRILDPDSMPSLKKVIMGGEAVLQSDLDRWGSKVRLISGYGPTETCIISFIGELTPTTPPNTIGRPVICRAWVLNPLKSELAPIGGVGELYVEGPCLSRGYHDNPQATASAFIDNPDWLPGRRVYRTGDYVYFNKDKTLSFIARKDNQVKIRGQRVELSEIEEAIRGKIAELTVAVDVFCPNGKQTLAAVFGIEGRLALPSSGVVESGPEVVGFMRSMAADLKVHLADVLPRHMVPEVYLPLARLPVQTSGKLDRRTLQSIINSMSAKSVAAYAGDDDAKQAPQTPHERVLARLWCKALEIADVQSVSASDNFFSNGGDSLLAMKLVSLLRAEGYSLAVSEIFSHPRLSAMASEMQALEVTAELSPELQQLPEAADQVSELDAQSRLSIAKTCNVKPDCIEDVYRCTYMQEFFMEDTVRVPGAHVAQFVFAVDSRVDLARLKDSIDFCVRKFPILRTRLVQHSGQWHQVVLDDQIPWIEASGKNLDAVLEDDKFVPTGLGDQLIRITVVRDKSGCHLIWTLHHSLYDAWSLRLLFEALYRAYEGAEMAAHLSSPRDLIKRLATRNEVTDRSFWATYLSGAGVPPLFGYAFVRHAVKDRRRDYSASLPPKVRGATLAATLASAWIRAVGRAANSSDVVIGYLVAGRTNMPSVQSCVGPVISKVPLRVRLEEGETGREVSEKVHAELTRLMPYELSGLKTVMSASQDASDACRFPLDLTVHPQGNLRFAVEDVGMRFVRGEVAAAPPGGLSVECAMKEDGVDVSIFWDQRAAQEDQIDALFEDFKVLLLK